MSEPSGQTTPSDDKKEWDFWADNPNLKCSTCGNPARTTLTDMESKPKVYGPYYDTEGESQAYCVYCNAAAYAENFYSNDYAFGSEEDGDDETLRELMESGVLFIGSKPRKAADSKHRAKMARIVELLKRSTEMKVRTAATGEFICYVAVIGERDYKEALSILEALAPTEEKQDGP